MTYPSKELHDGITKILELRRAVFRPNQTDFFLFLAAVVSSWFFYPLPALFMAILGIRIYRRLRYAAHYPCPRCQKPFGSTWEWPLGVGTDNCQSCDLSILESLRR